VRKPSFLILDSIYVGLNHTKDTGIKANRTASKKPYKDFHFQIYHPNGDLRVVLDPLSRAQCASDFWPARVGGKGNKQIGFVVERHDGDGVLICLLHVARAARITAGKNGGLSDLRRMRIAMMGQNLIQ